VRDGSGDLIVGGYFTNGSDTDIIAIKYDTDWVLLSSVVYAGAGGVNDWGYGVAVDSAGLIYVTGNTVNTDQDVVTLRFALPGSVGGPQTRIWDGGGADNLASNPLNWSGNTAPVDGDSILFNATSVTPSSWDITGIALNDVTMAGDYDTGTLHLATHMVVNGDFTRSTGGVIMQTGADLRVRGDFSWGVGGSVFTNDSLIILDGSERQELSSGNSWLANLHIESSSEVVMTSKMYMLGEPALTHSSGDLRAGGFDHQFNGGWARTGGVFLAESSTITFGPQLDISSVSITGGSGAFNHVQLKSLSAVGASTLAVVSPLDIDGNFSLVNIHFVPGPYTHTLGGDWNMTGGSFGPATGTIRFDGSSTTISAVMPIVFNELELAGTYAAFNSSFSASTFTADTSGAALYFTADATYTFGTLAIGSPGLASRMSLRSSSDGTPWHLVVTGTAAVSRADVMDSDASGGILISAHDGDNLDAGANFNWSFQFTAPELSAPSFALTTPETGAVINHLGMIAGTAADASGVASASFAIQKDAGNYYDGTDFVSVTPVWLPADLITIDGSTLAYQAIYVTSDVVYTDGSSYSVDMTAADIYGSSAASAGLATITIDKTAPTAASFRVLTATGAEHPEGGMVDLLAGVTAQINIQDALAGLSQSTQAALGFGVSYSTTAGGSWSDGAWSVSTPSPGAFAFAEYQGKLYAAAYGGTFDVIAYDGIEWSGSATFTGQVYALAAHDGKLYAGTYVSAGTGAVYEFDGGSWSLSAEFPGETTVASLASYNGMLYAGTRQGAKIFAFDGSTWTLSADIAGNSGVISMAEYRGRLYAGTDAGGQVYVFDASTWSLSVDFAATGVYVRDLVVYDGKLYAGTSHVSGQASFGKVFAFDGAGWSELFDVSSVGETVVQDLAVYRGRLYAATSVLGSPDPDQGKVLVYDGAQWHESGGFPDDDVMNALGVYEGRLFAGSANTGAQIHVLDPPSVTLSGAEGSTSLETLSAYGLNLAESTNTETCGGSYPCGATNQVVFTYSDRAGNVKRAGPYAIAASANPPNLRVWDGGGADDLASNPQNWTLDTLPVSGDSVLFNATSLDNDCTWDLTGVTLNDFTLAADFQHATRVTLSTDLVVAGDLVVSEGQFLENRQKMIIGGDWTMNGGGVMVSAHIILNGSSPQTINGPYSFSGSTITIQSTSEVVMNTRMYIDDGWFELKSGTFSAGSFDHWFGGHWTQTGGYFNAQDSTLTVINTEAEYPQTFTTLPGSPFNNFVINTTTDVTVLSALDINGNFIIRNDPTWSTGTFHAGDFTHTVAGHFLHSAGYFDPGAGTIKFDGAENSSVTVRSDFAFHGLEVAKSVGTKHLYALSDIVANGTMSVTAGSWWPMAHTHRFRGNIDSPLGRMLSGTGTTYLDGSSPQTMTGSSDNFWDLVIANAAGVTMPGSAYGLNIQGDLTIMPGASFDATDDYFWVQGDVIASGTFTGGGASILTLNGSAHQRVYGNGNSVGGIAVTNISSVTFVSSFTATSLAANASGGTLFFNAGSTFTVADFRPGNAGTAERLRLRSTADGSPWHLVVTSTAAPVRVDARDSDAAGGDTVLANDKDNLDSGNNVNWIFVFPQMPDPPTATVHGASSITWNWSAAPGASTYRVYPASETSTLLYETSVLSYAATGLGANERHRIGLAAAQGTINTALAYSATVHTLARPPTATTMNAVYQTSASFSWGLNGNSAFTAAEVQRSTDAAGYSAIGIMPVTSITAYHLIGCTTYYFRVRNVNGDGLTTSFDSTISTYTGAPTPAPPGELNARSLAGSKILLNWVRSPFAGVTAYRIYYGSGAASADVYAATPVEVSSAATSYTTPALGSGDTYAFGLRAVHACGIEEQNTRVRAFATALASLDGVRAAIKVPHSGKTIGGNRVTIVAELELGDPGQTQKVTFQYKASSDTTGWADIPAVNTGGRHPNPDLTAPYFIHWDVDAPLDETDYDLRVVAWDIFGASDTSPGAITITIDRADPDIAETKLVAGANTGKVEKKQKIHQELTSTVQSSAEDTSQATEVVIPPNAINASTVTVTVINNPATAPPAPSEVTATTIISEVSLSNDQHQLSGGNVAAVTLHYPDDDNNGIIDGTAISAASLQLYSATCSTCSWSKDFASTVNTASKTITGYTPHFSFFAAFVPAAAPAHADLSAVRVYPNPYKPNNGNNDDGIPFAAGNAASGIIFDQLPADAGIKIYTVTGRRVAELNSAAAGTIQWDARNDAGRDVASGLYIAVITGTGQVSVVRKLLLVR
ncbi:MAG: SBBP repeat-containing protein, partial [Elusimicrobiota bacterium]